MDNLVCLIFSYATYFHQIESGFVICEVGDAENKKSDVLDRVFNDRIFGTDSLTTDVIKVVPLSKMKDVVFIHNDFVRYAKI